ncbi:MAG: sulfatase-like hydrolase/transferase [Holosporales bacterium]|jgi:glucan phosphoethanolaminetransferase (alkaline phosphatase superfamily)|nr:sulfatase-like hydrolase/transferase [Holosporales bacterium]
MTSEMEDVLLEVGNVFLNYIYIIPTVIIPFLLILYCAGKQRRKAAFGTVILFSVFMSVGIRLYAISAPRFTPNEFRFTIDNSIKTFFGYWIILLKNYQVKGYKKYEIIDLKTNIPEKINIVYIIGESVNYKHMSLFGYERNTTPNLRNLAKESNFLYTQGISSAIATLPACKFIANAICEPDNVIQTSMDTTNLFKLAKQKGFKTFYISSQSDHLLSAIGGISYIDIIVTKDSNTLKCNELMDEYLFEILSLQKFEDRNFIILHQRCIHSPYTKTFGKDYKNGNAFKGSNNKIVDEYDNAMLYNDYLIYRMFNFFNKQKEGKFYIIWASDHNELMGENGLYGHGHGYLLPETADIPIVIQSNDLDFLGRIRDLFRPTHYEIAKHIAGLLGYEVKNPNEEKDVFYISGVDYNGKCGYIRLRKDPVAQKVKYSEDKDPTS